MSTQSDKFSRELTAREMDGVTGGSKELKNIAEAAAKAAQNAGGGFSGLLDSFQDLLGSRL